MMMIWKIRGHDDDADDDVIMLMMTMRRSEKCQ